MDKILYLEPDEEITSVVDRINNVKEKNISLVVPRGATLFQSLVNLKILKKQSGLKDKTISVVTTDQIGRKLAAQTGFRVFGNIDQPKEIPEIQKPKEEKMSISEIQYKKTPLDNQKEVKAQESKSEPEPPFIPGKSKKSRKFWYIIIPLIIVLLFGSAFALFLLLPKASVKIAVKSEPLDHSMNVVVDKTLSEVKSDIKTIPGEILEAVKEGNKKQTATGKKDVGEKAKGNITVYNYWDSNPQPLVAGTRFQSNSTARIYKTSVAVTVPGTTIEEGNVVPGTAQVAVVALENGDEYNIGPDTFKIPGLPAEKQAKIYGKSTSSFSGGVKKEITVVSQKDIDTLYQTLLMELSQQAKQSIDDRVKDDQDLLDKAIDTEVVSSAPSPTVNQEAQEVTLTMKIQSRALIYKKNDLKQVIEADLKNKITEDKVLVAPDENINKEVTSLDVDKGQMRMNLEVRAKIAPKLDENKLKQNIMGKKSQEAEDYLKTFSEIEFANVSLWPFWVKKVPNLNNRIKIEVTYSTTTSQEANTQENK